MNTNNSDHDAAAILRELEQTRADLLAIRFHWWNRYRKTLEAWRESQLELNATLQNLTKHLLNEYN